MFHEVWESERFQPVDMTFKVFQGHWQWCRSIGHVRFPISIQWQLSLYCTFNETLSLISHNFQSANDSGHILFGVTYHACTCTPVYQSANEIWSCLASPISKIWLGRDLETGHVTLITLIGVVCQPNTSIWVFCMHTKFGNYRFRRSGDMIADVKIENGSRDNDHVFIVRRLVGYLSWWTC